MKKNLLSLQYYRICALYKKLNERFEKALRENRFKNFTRKKQLQIIFRLEKLKARLVSLEQTLKLSGSVLLLGLTLNAGTISAQTPVAAGSEFLVNTTTTGVQYSPSIAMDSDGDYVVTWQTQNHGEGEWSEIYARRYNSSGVAQGAEFKVNQYTSRDQSTPVIAMDSDGNFVIAWQSDGQDGDGPSIYAKRYNASGVALGSEFRVTTSYQDAPSIAMNAAGDFIITWNSLNQIGQQQEIYGQRYNAAGTAISSEFLINTYTISAQNGSFVDMNDNGAFVVAWQSFNQDGSFGGIFAQRYDASGVAQGSEFQVNVYTNGYQNNPSVSIANNGNFIISWGSNNLDGSGDGVFASLYDATGALLKTEFQVNTYTTNSQNFSWVDMMPDGQFIIAWNSYFNDATGGVSVQRFDATGTAQGSEFRINTFTTDNQSNPAIEIDAMGDFVAVWQSNGQDGDNQGVYGQRYAVPNDAPTDLSLSVTSLDENVAAASAVGTLGTTDPDAGNTFTYSLVTGSGDEDNAAFTIDGSNLKIVNSPDFESKSTFSIRLRTTDQGGLTYEEAVTISVNDVNEAPTNITLDNSTVAENNGSGTTIGTLSATDADASNTFTYSLVSGTGDTDNALFSISGDQLQLASFTNYENKSSCSIRIRTTDQGGLTFEKIFTITITDVNEEPYELQVSAGTIDENVAAVTTFTALSTTDPDASNTFTYTLVSGFGSSDNSYFTISGNELKLVTSPDYETKNGYNIRIRTTDQDGLYFEEVFGLGVNDVNDSPVINAQTFSVDENSTASASVGTVVTSDQDNNTLTYEITAGNTGTAFAINSSTGQITVAGSLDYETTSSYSLTVKVTDNGSSALSSSATITININDLTETGIADAQINNVINVFPNPSSEVVTITADGMNLKNSRITLVNILGESVYSSTFTEQINIQNLPSGVYSLIVESEKGTLVKQIVIE